MIIGSCAGGSGVAGKKKHVFIGFLFYKKNLSFFLIILPRWNLISDCNLWGASTFSSLCFSCLGFFFFFFMNYWWFPLEINLSVSLYWERNIFFFFCLFSYLYVKDNISMDCANQHLFSWAMDCQNFRSI